MGLRIWGCGGGFEGGVEEEVEGSVIRRYAMVFKESFFYFCACL